MLVRRFIQRMLLRDRRDHLEQPPLLLRFPLGAGISLEPVGTPYCEQDPDHPACPDDLVGRAYHLRVYSHPSRSVDAIAEPVEIAVRKATHITCFTAHSSSFPVLTLKPSGIISSALPDPCEATGALVPKIIFRTFFGAVSSLSNKPLTYWHHNETAKLCVFAATRNLRMLRSVSEGCTKLPPQDRDAACFGVGGAHIDEGLRGPYCGQCRCGGSARPPKVGQRIDSW